MGLKIGKKYTDGWGKEHLIEGRSNSNPTEWVKDSDGAVFRGIDGRKCVWDSIGRRWHCPMSASNWDLVLTSEAMA